MGPRPPMGWPTGSGPPERWTKHSRGRTYVLPAVVAFIQVLGTYFASDHQTGFRDFDLVPPAQLAGPAALVFRNLYPVPVLGIVFVSTVAYGISDYPCGPMFVALFFASMKAVMRGHRIAFVATLVGIFVSFLWGPVVVGTGPSPSYGEILGVGAWLLFLGVVTEFMRSKRAEVIADGANPALGLVPPTEREALAHCVLSSRRAGSQHLVDQRAGRCCPAPHGRAPRAGADRPQRRSRTQATRLWGSCVRSSTSSGSGRKVPRAARPRDWLTSTS